MARLAEVFSPGGKSGPARKKPRPELNIEELVGAQRCALQAIKVVNAGKVTSAVVV